MSANPIDLTDLATVKNFAEVSSSADDAVIQMLITGFSRFALGQTGRGSLNTVSHYVENYDGNGNERLFLKNYPIITVNSLIINGVMTPQSTSATSTGFIIDQSGKSLVFRSFGGSGYRGVGYRMLTCFYRGLANVQVDYTAGYSGVPEDLGMMATRVVSTYYKRHTVIDMASKAFGGQGATGTTRYRDWSMSPEDRDVLNLYIRRSFI